MGTVIKFYSKSKFNLRSIWNGNEVNLKYWRVVVTQIVRRSQLLMFEFLIYFEGKITLPKIGKEVENVNSGQFDSNKIK